MDSAENNKTMIVNWVKRLDENDPSLKKSKSFRASEVEIDVDFKPDIEKRTITKEGASQATIVDPKVTYFDLELS